MMAKLPPLTTEQRVNKINCDPLIGHLFIISAPSGTGKSTLCNAVRSILKDLTYSISFTTRHPRKGEQEGREYYFIPKSEFKEGIYNGRWAEWAKVHGNYYGSSAQWIDDTLKSGRDILMDIDLQGTKQMIERFPQAVTIFIMPPSMDELKRRLESRGTDSAETIALRLSNARAEISQKGICEHELLNDNLNQATTDLIALINTYRND